MTKPNSGPSPTMLRCPHFKNLKSSSVFVVIMAHVLNATLRLSQRASTRKVSHVLSGSTRSLSSTSSPAARACAARNASFVTAFSSSRCSTVFPHVRAFSTKPEEVEERADSVLGGVKETIEQAQTEQVEESQSEEPWQPRRGTVEQQLLAPSKTFFVSGLPFFATEEDVRKVFEDCGTVMNVRFGSMYSRFPSHRLN